MQAYGYARVSTREQADSSHALEQQIARLEASGAIEILFDVDSGSKDNRPSFNQLMSKVRLGQVSTVIITRLDRLTRSLITLRKTLDEFNKFGVTLIALDDSIDTSTAAGKFHLNMLGALSEMEVDRLSERVRHGWQHLRSRKVAMNPPFGYIKVEDGHQLDHKLFLCLVSDRTECSRAEIAQMIIDAFLEKKTLRLTLREINERFGIQTIAHNNKAGEKMGGRVAQQMFRFSHGGLRNWLTNPVLQGHLPYLRKSKQPTIYYNTHPEHRLISDEEIATINEILATNARVRGFGSTALKYPASGLVFCYECRGACYSMSGANNYHKAKKLGIPPDMNYYFQCKNWRVRSCGNKTLIRMEKVEAAIITALTEANSAIALVGLMPRSEDEPIELKELRSSLTALQMLGNNSAITGAIASLESQISNYIHCEKADSAMLTGNKEYLMSIFSEVAFWEHLTDSEKQVVFRRLVERVVVKGGNIISVILKV